MVAVECNVPVFILAADHRVKELAETMQIPHTTVYDPNIREKHFDFSSILRGYGFDGGRFDRNRCKIAKTYVEQLSRYRIPLARHVYEIAKSCQ